jgi:hypothetical protein
MGYDAFLVTTLLFGRFGHKCIWNVQRTTSFNPDISIWNVSSATLFDEMFRCHFLQSGPIHLGYWLFDVFRQYVQRRNIIQPNSVLICRVLTQATCTTVVCF